MLRVFTAETRLDKANTKNMSISSSNCCCAVIELHTLHTKIYIAQHSQACSSNHRRRQSLGGGC